MQHNPNAPDIHLHRHYRKSSDRIQAEIDLMRLAYRERCEEQDTKPVSPIAKAAPYLVSLGIMVGLMFWFIL